MKTSGEKSCRFRYPKPFVNETTFRQLRSSDNECGFEIVEIESNIPIDCTKDRDFLYYPFEKKDPRIIVCDFKRPELNFNCELLSINKLEKEYYDNHIKNVDNIDLDDNTGNIQQKSFQNIPRVNNNQTKLSSELSKRNSNIVCFNKTITNICSCNTACYMLGSTEQAKATLFYLIKYITKGKFDLTNCLSIMKYSIDHFTKYKEKEYKDDKERQAMYILERMNNHILGMIEVSSTQMIADLIDLSSTQCSTAFITVFVKPFINFLDNNENDLAITTKYIQ
jgi:hypothetical protein